jgi:hypothetical protein
MCKQSVVRVADLPDWASVEHDQTTEHVPQPTNDTKHRPKPQTSKLCTVAQFFREKYCHTIPDTVSDQEPGHTWQVRRELLNHKCTISQLVPAVV